MGLTLVNTEAAVAQEKQGTTAVASGNTEPASDAFYKLINSNADIQVNTLTWPPIDIPVIPTGPIPWLCSQSCNTYDSKTSAAPITSKSDT